MRRQADRQVQEEDAKTTDKLVNSMEKHNDKEALVQDVQTMQFSNFSLWNKNDGEP
jgi:hypothetical protein